MGHTVAHVGGLDGQFGAAEADAAAVNPSDLPLSLLPQGMGGAVRERIEQLYIALCATNEAILRCGEAGDLYRRICDAAVGSGFIHVAALMVPGAEPARELHTAAASNGSGLARVRISVDPDEPEGRGLVGSAFQSRQTSVSHDLLDDPRLAPWRAAVSAAGLQSGAAVPLLRDGRVVAVLLLYSKLRGAFDRATVLLFERVAENACYALAAFDRDAERARLSEELQRFRSAVDLSGDSLYITDAQTLRFIDVNETACRRLGFPRDELLTKTPMDASNKSRAEIEALYEQVVAQAPEALITEQVGTSREGRQWMSEVSRRALHINGRWLIVTTSRNIDERRCHEWLQVLQHDVTRQLAQIGEIGGVLDSVLGRVGAALDIEEALCVASPPEDSTVAPALGRWRRDADMSRPADTAGTLARALITAPNRLDGEPDGELLRWVMPLIVDARPVGALALIGAALPALPRLDQVLFGIGEQIGQYIRRKEAEDVVRRSEARFRALTELSSDWYWETDTQHRFVSFGGRHVKDAGSSDWRSEFFGLALWELPRLAPEGVDWPQHRASLERRERFDDFQFAVRVGRGGRRWTSASGEPVFGSDGSFRGYRGVSRDITERRRQEESIRHLATHDSLTGLPNRALFTEALGQSLHDARANGRHLALVFLDLDHFKVINDTLGHDAGDELLVTMAGCLRDALRPEDMVARLGGDEFVALVRHPVGREDAGVVARKLLAAATRPMRLKGQDCQVSASIGIAIYPDDGEDEAALMRGADSAMYQAKREGRNGFRFHSSQVPALSLERLRMENSLRGALARDEFTLHFQPKVELTSGAIVGAEALLRWSNAECGSVPPAQFIALAEETGIILPIGRWVLEQACRQHMAWRRQGLPPIPIAVNMSPRQFADDELVPDIERALADCGMPAGALELEITESVMLVEPERALRKLQAIKALGVRLAIDDFGTGYSSLAQLKRFPIDSLKIDRSFVSGLPGDITDVAIAEAIIVMCRALHLTVVAEGVETAEQREFLRDRGCAQMQGYQFSRPLAAAPFAALVRAHFGPGSRATTCSPD